MKINFVFLIVVLFKNVVFSQSKIIQLHPILGDTIDLVEKRDYFLFPEVKDATYVYGILERKDSIVRFVSYQFSDTISVNVNQQKISEYQRNIDKLYAYYKNQSVSDSLKIKSTGFMESKTAPGQKLVNPVKLSEAGKKLIGEESKRLIRLKNEAAKRRLIGEEKQVFMTNGPGGMELFSVKTKKKKEKEKLF